MTAGYSGTPLKRKLGYVGPVWARNMPGSVAAEIGTPEGGWLDGPAGARAAHLFHTRRADMAQDLAKARTDLSDDAMVWVFWPKKAARVETDITEDAARAEALPMGFVDVKVCAVDAVWSGLKLVVRKALRVSPAGAVVLVLGFATPGDAQQAFHAEWCHPDWGAALFWDAYGIGLGEHGVCDWAAPPSDAPVYRTTLTCATMVSDGQGGWQPTNPQTHAFAATLTDGGALEVQFNDDAPVVMTRCDS